MKGFKTHELIQGPYLAMVCSEKEFKKRVRSLTGRPTDLPWMQENDFACVNIFTSDNGDLAVIVSIPLRPKDEDFTVMTVLVHEAAHVWQAWCKHVGEDSPGEEVEAYAIQNIFRWLAEEYARHQQRRATKGKKI